MQIETDEKVFYSEYRELLNLYIKQMGKTSSLQRENDYLHNLVGELRSGIKCGQVKR